MQFTPISLLFHGKVLAEPLSQCIDLGNSCPSLSPFASSSWIKTTQLQEIECFLSLDHRAFTLLPLHTPFLKSSGVTFPGCTPEQAMLVSTDTGNILCLFSRIITLCEMYFLGMSCVYCRVNVSGGLDNVGCLGSY